MKNDPPDKRVLDYQRPARDADREPGCGILVLHTLGGLALGVLFLLTARSISAVNHGGPGGLIATILLFSIGLVLAIVLAMNRRPGYLIGYLMVWGIFGLLLAACGPTVLR